MTGGAASMEKQGVHNKPHHLPNIKYMDTNCTMYNTEVPDFGEFLLKETFADVHLVCKGHKIPAHRSRLSSVSPFLAAVFAGDTSEVSVVIVPDVRYEALRLLIHFLYTGFMRATENEVHEILEAGHTLGIDRAIDVERDNSFSVVEPVRNRKRLAAEPLDMERKKKSARQSTVFIINTGEYMTSETGSLCNPGDDPLNIADACCSTLVTQAQHSGSKEQTGKDPSSPPSLGLRSRMPMAEYPLLHSQDQALKTTQDSGRTPGISPSIESHAPKDQQMAPEQPGQQDEAQQATSQPPEVNQDLVSSQAPSSQDLAVGLEESSSTNLLPNQAVPSACQSKAQREINVVREVPTSSRLATQHSSVNPTPQSHHQPSNSSQNQCQLSKSPVKQGELQESLSTQNIPESGILAEQAMCASQKQQHTATTSQAQCQQNRNPENLLANKQQSSLVQRKDSSTPQAENQAVQIKREAIEQERQNFVPPMVLEQQTTVSRESTNPPLQGPQHSNSNVSQTQQNTKPAGLKQTVQQAVAGLLLWKNSQLKHGSPSSLGKQPLLATQSTKLANQQQGVATVDLQHPTLSIESTAIQDPSELVCQEPMTVGSEESEQNLSKNPQQVSQLAVLGLQPISAQQKLVSTELGQNSSTGQLYQGSQSAELSQTSTPAQQQSPPVVKLNPKPMTINPQFQKSLLLQFQKHKLAMQTSSTQRPSSTISSPAWTAADKATLERAVSEQMSSSPEQTPSRAKENE